MSIKIWDYRFICSGDRETLHEVFYNDRGEPCMATDALTSVEFTCPKIMIAMLLEALEKPRLTPQLKPAIPTDPQL